MSLPTKEELEYLGSRTMKGIELMTSFIPEEGKASDLLYEAKKAMGTIVVEVSKLVEKERARRIAAGEEGQEPECCKENVENLE
jgi:hypothetical protein